MVQQDMMWSIKTCWKMIKDMKALFNNIFQRSFVWEPERKSRLIWSTMEGYPIPPFYARRIDGKKYDFLDGKQRMNAFYGFLNDDYYLIGIPPVTVTNEDGEEVEMDVNGRTFSQLPEELQDRIKDYTVHVYYYDGITDEQVRLLFANLNNGKPLSTKDRNIANCVDLANVSDLGQHDLFKAILTEKGLSTRKHLPMVMKVWEMQNMEISDVSFESRVFNDIIVDTRMTEEETANVKAFLDRYFLIYNKVSELNETRIAKKIMRKMASETHMISLVPFVMQSIAEDVSIDMMAGFMAYLFSDEVTVSEAYEEASKNGSAKNVNIRRRHEALRQKWQEYFTED